MAMMGIKYYFLVPVALAIFWVSVAPSHLDQTAQIAPLEEEDATSMLQVYHHVDDRKEVLRQGDDTIDTNFTIALDETSSCIRYTPLDLQFGYEALRFFAYADPRPHCTLPDPSGGHFKKALSLVSDMSAEYIGVDQQLVPALFPITFVVIFFALIMRMLINIAFPRYSQKSTPWKTDRRPEAESWNRGILNWLYVDFVSDWVARWGHSSNSEQTRIQSDDLGLLGDPEDDCENCYDRLEVLWKAELQEVGLEKASLVQVMARFVTWKRIMTLAFWTALYEAFMYVGPPLAMSLLIQMMDDIYLKRLQGYQVQPADLLPASIVAMCLFTGLPIMCGVANTFTAMLSMRMSARIVGGLSCLVYCKAQRLPTSSQIEVNDEFETNNKEGKANAEQTKGENTAEAEGEQKKDEADKEDGDKKDSEEPDWEDHQDIPDKFNLVQVVTNDINDTILAVPLQMSKAIITLPIVIFLFCCLFAHIGATMFVCVFMCICVTFVLICVAGAMASNTYGFMFWSGKRLQFLEELLFNIRVVKCCGWESVAEVRIEEIRGKEIERLKGYFYALGWFWTFIMQYPNVLIATSLWGYMWLNGKTQVTDIWTLLPLLYTFQSAIIALLSTMPTVVNAMPCIMRVQGFLKQKEAPNGVPRSEEVPLWMEVWPETHKRNDPKIDPRITPLPLPVEASLLSAACRVRVQGDFSWTQHGAPTLQSVDLSIPAGSSLGILGKVGSGKSTLLMAMLGELFPQGDSRISVPNRMAFSAQTPYIMEGTLRDNILCTSSFEQERYQACIHAACLFPDLEVLPGGEMVPIGSRGISLSGGQKARVSMARAAYSNAPLVIVDDPFSALDSRTGLHILDHYVFGDCLKGSTRVIVTQPDAERIQRFDHVVILTEGRIAVQGTPAEIIETEEYIALLSSHQKAELEKEKEDAEPKKERERADTAVTVSSTRKEKSDVFELREEEFEGRASWDNVAYFATIGGYWNTFVLMFGFLGVMCCNLLCKVVLQHWSTEQMMYTAHRLDTLHSGTSFFWPFFAWWMASIAAYWFVYWHGIKLTLNMSRFASKDTVKRLLHAPVDRFFDKTPVGRIMNRLSTDLMNIDKNCFNDIASLFTIFWQDSVPILYVHFLMPVYFTIASIPLYTFLIFVIRRYANTMVPMRYLTHVSKSRTDTTLTEVDNSLPFIRATQAGDYKFAEFMEKLGNQIKADVGTQTFVKRWVIQRLFLLIGFYMTSMVLLCIWVPGVLSFGALGLCLTNMLQICVSIENDMDVFIKAQYQFISMNRLHEYTKLPQEKPSLLDGDNRYQSFALWLQRDSLGDLMYDSNGTKCITVWRRDSKGTLSDMVLVQKQGTNEFVAPPGKTFACLKPGDEQLRKTVAWHRLVEVNGTTGNAELMAKELCTAAPDQKVRLYIQSSWLADGARVLVEDLSVGYGDIPRNVLKDVSFTIDPCTNVAFVGSTGCGKSTLLLCMLRILERRTGSILINDVDIAKVGLQTLRTTIGLVPQDPVLMNASVRDNLDPFGFYDPSQIWDGLKMVGLDEEVNKMPEQLATVLAGEAANLSFGQRQLLCLARLCVRQPSLILLDEATSALDPKTQEVVQKTLESRFPKSTLMVIAHRLETVLGFDKIIVMDNGHVAEQGPVAKLASIKGGHFAKMLAAKKTW